MTDAIPVLLATIGNTEGAASPSMLALVTEADIIVQMVLFIFYTNCMFILTQVVYNFYNKFSGDIGRFSEHMETFAEEFSVRLSRRLAERLDE